jgi:dsRNA-specific ribonuclease
VKINDGLQYRVEVFNNNIRQGWGVGNKIKEAEMQAAKNAYYKLNKK